MSLLCVAWTIPTNRYIITQLQLFCMLLRLIIIFFILLPRNLLKRRPLGQSRDQESSTVRDAGGSSNGQQLWLGVPDKLGQERFERL